MKTFKVELTGKTPLLHHKMTEESIMGLLGPKSKKKKIKEEKLPREIAQEHAYRTIDGKYFIPLDYVCGAFKHVASDYKQTSGKKSYKAIAGGIFRPTEPSAILLKHDGSPIDNFEVDIRKATNHQAGAVIVCRPRFDEWKCQFTIEIDDSLIAPEVAQEILEDAGKRSGIGSFRVSKSGYFGQFMVTRFQPLET
jgi:hypothetical protein